MLMMLLSFLVMWELFYCSFRIATLTVCLSWNTEVIWGRLPLLHRVLQALPCLPCIRTSSIQLPDVIKSYSSQISHQYLWFPPANCAHLPTSTLLSLQPGFLFTSLPSLPLQSQRALEKAQTNKRFLKLQAVACLSSCHGPSPSHKSVTCI